MTETFRNPLPSVAMGDPFVLRHRGRFYLYGTNDGPPLPDGRQIPVFRSDDLLHWEPLGGALEAASGEPADYWAPEVFSWNGRFYMAVSFGDVDRRGHALWVAVSDRPEGPFRLERRVSAPEEKFSIDGSWLLDDDGRLYLFRCLDFVEEGKPPYGTGIVVQEMRDPFTPIGPPSTVLRADAPWQVFERDRLMPLYDDRRFAEWTTIEGPAPVRRAGRYFCGYSGGNYARAYGTGEAAADAPLGPYTDLRGKEGPIFGTTPGLVEGPGHFSVVRPDGVHDWIVLHGRTPGEPVRRVWLCPAHWSEAGVTIGELTDRPQPRPPLASGRWRFASDGTAPGWEFDRESWRLDADGLRHIGSESGEARLPGSLGAGEWWVEVYVALPEGGAGRAGLMVGSESSGVSLRIDPGEGLAVVVGADGETASRPLPTLGDEPFAPSAYHALELLCRSGRVEARVDGVVVGSVRWAGGPSLALALRAEGPAAFDAASLTRIGPEDLA